MVSSCFRYLCNFWGLPLGHPWPIGCIALSLSSLSLRCSVYLTARISLDDICSCLWPGSLILLTFWVDGRIVPVQPVLFHPGLYPPQVGWASSTVDSLLFLTLSYWIKTGMSVGSPLGHPWPISCMALFLWCSVHRTARTSLDDIRSCQWPESLVLL